MEIREQETYDLENTWVLWYHDGKSDWTPESYQKIYEFSTIEDFWRLYNNLPSVVNHYFFLMKKGHPPIWEAKQNINGGSWLHKVPKVQADAYWLKFSMFLIGECMADDTDNLIGISISPKVHNVTMSVWNKDSLKCKDKIKFNPKYEELHQCPPLYKDFQEKYRQDQEKHKAKK
jgi:hypothetical protein